MPFGPFRLGCRVRTCRVPVTVVYALALVVVTTALLRLDPRAQARVIDHASTNLHNLSRGHVDTLLDSAFVVDAGPIWEWLPFLVALLAVGELVWRSGRLLVAFVVGHVGATLLVAAGLAAAVRFGWQPEAITTATDVGMSYGAVGVLGALTPAMGGARATWIGWWLALGLGAAVVGADFTSTGHLIALVLGMLVSTRFGVPRRWTPTRVALLAVGGYFGYLVMVDGDVSTMPATVAGLSGALLGTAVALLLRAADGVSPGDDDARVSPVTPEPSL